MVLWRQAQAYIVITALVVATAPLDGCKKAETNPAQNQASQPNAPPATAAMPTAEQLYQLVAPIALFPDNLVAIVLAASTFPDQVTAAQSWLQQNGSLKGANLQQAVDQQPWDASVKSLTTFPDVLSQMATNLTWTSALGDAYFNDQQNVMNAVQVMRQRAQAAGNLKSTPQQNVSVQNNPPAPPPDQSAGAQPTTTIVQPPPQTIVIQPAQPDVVYVPTYNPAVVYGAPVAVYPGYVAPPSTGAVVAAGLLSFGLGIAVGAAISNNYCCGWGYNSWGTNWHGGNVVYNRNVYVSNSTTFVNRNNYYNNRNNYYNNNHPRPTPYNGSNAYNNRNGNYRQPNYNQAAQNRPNFNSNLNQQQFRGTTFNQQGRPTTTAGANNRQPMQNNARPGTPNARPAGNQPNFANRQEGNRPGGNQPNFNRQGAQNTQQRNPAQNMQQRNPTQNAARGYGQQPNRGSGGGAFQNENRGGNARMDSSRGQQSMGVTRPSGNSGFGGGNRQASAGGGRGGGGERPARGGQRR
jgi:hypothetical protein